MASTLEKSIKHLLVELEAKEKEYEELSEQEKDNDNKNFFRGKRDAYWFASSQIKGLLKWHGLIE